MSTNDSAVSRREKRHQCILCEKPFASSELMPLAAVRPQLLDLAKAEKPETNHDSWICFRDLNRLRARYIEDELVADRGEMSNLEKSVVESLRQHEVAAATISEAPEERRSRGERISDALASFGGSWAFILMFGGTLVVWIVANGVDAKIGGSPFDPFPFIFLNLILSCLAALQAPVIMMSQNRLEKRDRMRADQDFRTNLKAELEIRHVNIKLDQLMTHQWQRLLEIQELQSDALREMQERSRTLESVRPAD